MLIPSGDPEAAFTGPSLSRRVNANSQPPLHVRALLAKLIKKGEC